MKLYRKIQIIAAIAGVLVIQTARAEPDFYTQFTSLIDTNRFGPPLTNSTLSLEKLMKGGEIAGVKLGTHMSAVVQQWGKPRTFYSSCGGGPLLAFGHGCLNFHGDKVVRITIFPDKIPGLKFENGLTATNSPAEFAMILGLAEPDAEQSWLILKSETCIVSLQWQPFAVGGLKLGNLALESRELSDPKNP
jgi:hypothetical protein